MRSPYFHKFTPNILGDAWFWFVFAVAAALIIAGYLLTYLKVEEGWTRYVKIIEPDGRVHTKKRRVPRPRTKINLDVMIALLVVLLIIFTILLVKGSGDGILQFFDNGLVGYESPAWSYVLAGGAIAVVDFVLGFVWLIAFSWGAMLKEKKLAPTLRKMERDQNVTVVDLREV